MLEGWSQLLAVPLIVVTIAGVAIGAVSLEQAFTSLDLNTLALLFAMMIINVNLRIAGFFEGVSTWVMASARSPRMLLALLVLLSGLLSALFLNDTIVLAFTPLVLEIALALRRNPIPYLAGLVTAANIGSVATIVGNPQNMLIGTTSGISYVTFSANLLPVGFAGLVLAWLVIVVVYPKEFVSVTFAAPVLRRQARHGYLLTKTLLATAVMLGLLLAGAPPTLAALVAASALLVTRRLKPERVFKEVDWSLLVFFAGLFVVTGVIERTPLLPVLEVLIRPALDHSVAAFAALAAVVSNLISNVPAVLVIRPAIEHAMQPDRAWLTLAMATTFAGNMTLLGSVANLIVAETARRHRVHLGFVEYLRAGVPITLASLGIGIAWLTLP
jgi:Na+/H+ antiporter NhaD/arsenite permease-like protein